MGGVFTQSADSSVSGLSHIAMFNTGSNTWSALSNGGLNGTVQALTVAGGYLVVGGQFDQTTDGAVTELNHIAAYSAVSSSFDVFLCFCQSKTSPLDHRKRTHLGHKDSIVIIENEPI